MKKYDYRTRITDSGSKKVLSVSYLSEMVEICKRENGYLHYIHLSEQEPVKGTSRRDMEEEGLLRYVEKTFFTKK